MSDFVSEFWNLYVIVIVLGSILACAGNRISPFWPAPLTSPVRLWVMIWLLAVIAFGWSIPYLTVWQPSKEIGAAILILRFHDIKTLAHRGVNNS